MSLKHGLYQETWDCLQSLQSDKKLLRYSTENSDHTALNWQTVLKTESDKLNVNVGCTKQVVQQVARKHCPFHIQRVYIKNWQGIENAMQCKLTIKFCRALKWISR